MKIGIAVAAGLGALSLAGALYGLEAVSAPKTARPLRTMGSVPARRLSPEEAQARLATIAYRGGERREFLRLLRELGAEARKEELLTIAAGARRPEVMEWLLSEGALPGGGSERPAAPLLAAAAAGDPVGVRLLIRAGATPDPRPPQPARRMHPTPLVAAICAGSLDCADALIEAGADPHAPIDVAGFTLDAVRRPPILRTPPSESRRLRRTTAFALAKLSPNRTMPLVVGRERARPVAGLVVASR